MWPERLPERLAVYAAVFACAAIICHARGAEPWYVAFVAFAVGSAATAYCCLLYRGSQRRAHRARLPEDHRAGR